jgi:hypothetical protein
MKPTTLEKSEKWKLMFERKRMLKSLAEPPIHDCKMRETKSSLRRMEEQPNVATKKNSRERGEIWKLTDEEK